MSASTLGPFSEKICHRNVMNVSQAQAKGLHALLETLRDVLETPSRMPFTKPLQPSETPPLALILIINSAQAEGSLGVISASGTEQARFIKTTSYSVLGHVSNASLCRFRSETRNLPQIVAVEMKPLQLEVRVSVEQRHVSSSSLNHWEKKKQKQKNRRLDSGPVCYCQN